MMSLKEEEDVVFGNLKLKSSYVKQSSKLTWEIISSYLDVVMAALY